MTDEGRGQDGIRERYIMWQREMLGHLLKEECLG